MATESSNNANSGLSLQEQLFAAIQNKYPDAEAKKINKDNFLDIYIPSISPGRGTHLFFNTVKGAIKIGYYTRDEDFINKVVSTASEFIDGASNGMRITGNPKFDDLESATAAALDFLSNMTNDSPVNTIIEDKKSIEIESTEDVATKFRDSYSDEEELAESISSYLDDFSEKGKIVVLQIEEEDLIKSTNNHDLLSGDLFTLIGIVDIKSWKPLSKLIGKAESDWVNNEFKDEDPGGIVLLYCDGKYVYSFSNPKEEDSDDELIEENGTLKIDEVTIPQIIAEINADKNLKHIQITYYINNYSDLYYGLVYKVSNSNVEVNRVNWYNDSYWTGEIEREDLIEGLTEYLKGNINGLELFEGYIHADDWKFDRAGTLDNGAEFSITDLNGLTDIPKNLQDEDGDLDVWELSNYIIPEEEDLYDENKGLVFTYEFSLNGKTYGLIIDRLNEEEDEEEVDNDALMAARWKDETPARITLLFDSLLAILSHFHTRGSNDDDIQYFMVEFENITSSEIILSNTKILDKVRKKVMKEWDEKDEEEWIERYCSAYEILVRDFNLVSEINKSLITLSRIPEEDSGEYNLSVLANLDLPLTIFPNTDIINNEVAAPKNRKQIGMYNYDILECSVQELIKDINRRNISNETKIEIIAYNNTLTEFDEDYTLEIDGQEVWLTISRSFNDSYWKTQLDNQELSNLFNCIQEQGFKYGLDEVLYGREFYAPGDSDNSFEIKLKECNEELLPENCFDGGEVNPYYIFDEYESNLEDVDITLRGETERLDIIINEEYIGSIWSGAYPSK
ncbi:MAG: hypothetical protein CK547_07080 [Chitinophagaceae bacterium]|nr:MAG: hypothetical protein CK547_07080 [Chitinophagaceae bacterium]